MRCLREAKLFLREARGQDETETEQWRAGEAGEALIEFIAVMILFVIPVFYIILSLGQVQAATYAAEAAARNGARILAAHPQAHALAERQVQLAFSDFGLAPPMFHAVCQPADCSTGGVVTVTVEARTPLPLVPDWVGARAFIPVVAQVGMPVEGLSVHGLE
ncbi:hypothetical protein [Schaalia sp. Marseille-Q2122]|uniref:hypothetical protein n=1 Tax=Schaalia sp. Marseille-Q2122 TaxID=2736604 RepID=UPI00158D6CB9|nr:hypothetical protein [Schaalia sp. Marseille-Q2122]